jgi:putative ABC transport system permease protein
MNLSYAWAELLGKGERSLLNILGMAIAITLFISLTSFSQAYRDAAEKPFRDMGADLTVQGLSDDEIFRLDGNEFVLPYRSRLLQDNEIEEMKSIPGIQKVSTALVIWNFDPRRFNIIAGVSDVDVGPARSLAGTTVKHYEFDRANQRYIEVKSDVRSWMLQGRFFNNDEQDVAVLESHYAAWYNIHAGDTITLGGKKLLVTGTVEIKEGSQIAASNIYIPLKDAQEIMGVRSGTNLVFIKVDQTSRTQMVMKEIMEKFPGVEVSSSDSVLQLMGGIVAVSNRSAILASVIALIGAGAFIFKTTAENILRRTRDMGVLKAIGWTGNDLQGQILAEIVIQVMLGWLIGVLLGYTVTYLMGGISIEVPVPLGSSPTFTQGPSDAVQSIKLLIEIAPLTILFSLLVPLAIAGVTGLVLSRRVIKMRPAEALIYS